MEKTVLDNTNIMIANLTLKEVEEIVTLAITNDQDANIWKEFALGLGNLSKAIDKERKENVRPALDEQARVNEFYSPTIKRLDDVSRQIMSKLNDYVKAQAIVKREAEAKLVADNIAKLKLGELTPTVFRTLEPGIITIQTRKSWTFEVVDLSLVPRSCLMVDEAHVQRMIKSGLRDIKGIKIFEEETVVRR